MLHVPPACLSDPEIEATALKVVAGVLRNTRRINMIALTWEQFAPRTCPTARS